MASEYLVVNKNILRNSGINEAIAIAFLSEKFGRENASSVIPFLSTKMGLSIPTIRTLLARLEELDLIERVAYKDRAGYVYRVKKM